MKSKEIESIKMSKFGAEFWDERYNAEEYIYGIEPNIFFKEQLDKLIDAVDFSSAARDKSLKLANTFKVNINYIVADLQDYVPPKICYNVVSLIFCHLKPKLRSRIHQQMIDSLLPDGKIVLEVFDKDQLGKDSGGPQNEEMLYSLNEIKNDFSALHFELIVKQEIEIDEGEKHKGKASVIRFVGIKEKIDN
jgi:hypothetical protein